MNVVVAWGQRSGKWGREREDDIQDGHGGRSEDLREEGRRSG